MLELQFPIVGPQIPIDHGYLLYSALSTLLPALHNGELTYRLGPISGDRVEPGILRLNDYSRLRFRISTDNLPRLLPLAGKRLVVGSHPIRLGVPQVRALVPAPAVAARLVTIKGFTEPELFLEALRRQLSTLGTVGEPGIPLATAGPRVGQPLRRVLRIKDKKVVGFALHVTGLSAEESIRLQEHGLGGRGRMGCGFFVPVRSRGME